MTESLSQGQGASKFEEFISKLETGLRGGLPDVVKKSLYAIKSLDHKKDCKFLFCFFCKVNFCLSKSRSLQR